MWTVYKWLKKHLKCAMRQQANILNILIGKELCSLEKKKKKKKE